MHRHRWQRILLPTAPDSLVEEKLQAQEIHELRDETKLLPFLQYPLIAFTNNAARFLHHRILHWSVISPKSSPSRKDAISATRKRNDHILETDSALSRVHWISKVY
jgi:hypothetical protein